MPAPDLGIPCRPVTFGARVALTREEAFTACQVLADAERALRHAGHPVEADALAETFLLLEDLLTGGRRSAGPTGREHPAHGQPAHSPSGRYSMERELTQ